MQDREPLVSIITPSLNSEAFIEDAILSVRAQRHRRVEHVIVDGGSTDGTAAIVERYRGPNVRFYSGRDRGPTDATNRGASLAAGSIVGILPSDDLLLPWAASEAVRCFAKRPELGFVYGDVVLMPMGREYAGVAFNPDAGRLRRHLGFGPMNIQSAFWKKEAISELGGFDASLRVASDYDFSIRASMRYKYERVPTALAVFRYRNESVSVKDPSSLRRDRRVISKSRLGGAPLLSPALVLYEVLWSAHAMKNLIGFLHPQAADIAAREFMSAGAVSKPRLAGETLFAPLFYSTAFFDRRLRHGFLSSSEVVRLTRPGGSPAQAPVSTDKGRGTKVA